MTLRFNKKIYSQSAIEQAIKAYKEFANFNLRQNKNYFLIKIRSLQPRIKRNFQDEFSNYILSLIKK